MMGHTVSTQKNSTRLGFSDSNDSKDPEDEVNDYLMRAIDARSIDRLRSEHCKSVSLSFKKPSVEQKVRLNAFVLLSKGVDCVGASLFSTYQSRIECLPSTSTVVWAFSSE